jgi:hypothetical protein
MKKKYRMIRKEVCWGRFSPSMSIRYKTICDKNESFLLPFLAIADAIFQQKLARTEKLK